MDNIDFEEKCNCKFNCCPYFDFENDKCYLKICAKLNKK